MTIYLDSCCYNRPFDRQSQARIRAETAAVRSVVAWAQLYGYAVFGSEALDRELGNIKERVKYKQVQDFYRETVTCRALLKKAVLDHYFPVAVSAGISCSDARHLCHAISAGADYLLTTDDDFINFAAGLALPVVVINPINFPFGGTV